MKRRGFLSALFAAPAAGSIRVGTAARVYELAREDLHFKSTGGLMTAHQWGYYHARVTGSPAPPPHEIGLGDGFGLLTVEQYYGAMEKA